MKCTKHLNHWKSLNSLEVIHLNNVQRFTNCVGIVKNYKITKLDSQKKSSSALQVLSHLVLPAFGVRKGALCPLIRTASRV